MLSKPSSSKPRTATVQPIATTENHQSDRPGRGHSRQRSNPLPASKARARAVAKLQREGARKKENPGNVIKSRNPGMYGPRLRMSVTITRSVSSRTAGSRRDSRTMVMHARKRGINPM